MALLLWAVHVQKGTKAESLWLKSKKLNEQVKWMVLFVTKYLTMFNLLKYFLKIEGLECTVHS